MLVQRIAIYTESLNDRHTSSMRSNMHGKLTRVLCELQDTPVKEGHDLSNMYMHADESSSQHESLAWEQDYS